MQSYTEFKNNLENGQSFSVYLFEGEDVFFRERGLKLLVSKFVENPELNLVSLDGEFSVGELVAPLNGYPFMSPKRLTVVREFYPKQEHFKSGLKEYLDNPSDCSVLAILNGGACDALKKYQSVCVVDCKKADASLLVKWIKAECGKSSVVIDGETARLLAEYCSFDMTRIETETTKLIAYVGQGGNIDKTALELMVARDSEYKIYEMTDFIGRKKFDKALAIITDMMSKGETPQRIINSIYNYFRRLLHAGISGKGQAELASAFGIKEFAARKIKEQSAMFKKKALKNAVDVLTDVDYKIKSGRLDATEGVFLSVFKIMTDI